MQLTDIECWKDVPGYEGRYQISYQGKIKSIQREVRCRNQICSFYRVYPEKLLSFNDIGGYKQVRLYKEGKSQDYLVHRLVAMTFISNPNQYEEVNHIDGDKSNNCVDNLEWCSRHQNIHHAIATGLLDPGKSNRGRKFTSEHCKRISKSLKGRIIDDVWRDKLRTSHIHQAKSCMCVEDNIKFLSYAEAGRYYNIDPTSVSHSVQCKTTTKIGKTFVSA